MLQNEAHSVKMTVCGTIAYTKANMSKSKSKSKYRLSNWSENNASLKQKGSLTFWLTDEVIEQWANQHRTGRRGASNTYGDVAIELIQDLRNDTNYSGII